MLIDMHQPEDVFARVPELAAQIDPVLQALDGLLEDDQLYRQVRADLGKRYRFTLVHGRHSTPVEVILRLLLCRAPVRMELRGNHRAGGRQSGTALVLSRLFSSGARQEHAHSLDPHPAPGDAACARASGWSNWRGRPR